MTKFEIPILKKEYGNLPIAEWLLVKNIVGSCPYAVLVIEYLNLGFICNLVIVIWDLKKNGDRTKCPDPIKFNTFDY
jgi:hypothetical protein